MSVISAIMLLIYFNYNDIILLFAKFLQSKIFNLSCLLWPKKVNKNEV